MAALSGCGTIPFHSETRDKQGQAAKAAWAEVDAKAQIQAARDNHARLVERELRVVDQLAATRREVTSRGLAVEGTVDEMLVKPAQTELARLAGSVELATAWTEADGKERLARAKVQDVAQEFENTGLEMPACADLLASEPAALEPLTKSIAAGGHRGSVDRQALGAARTACAGADLSATSSAAVGGGIRGTVVELRTAASALESERLKALNLRNA